MAANKNINELADAFRHIMATDRVHLEEPLSLHTTFKIGGPADIFVEPTTMEELSATLKLIGEYNVPLTVLGCGSNVLVKDGGIRGAVVNLCKMTTVKECKGSVIRMGSGFLLKDVSEYAWANSLTGLEFAVGIPGSLGGAVFMNAGAYIGDMSNVVTKVKTVDLQGNPKEYGPEEFNFAYRHSVFQDNHEVIGEVEMTLAPGKASEIKAVMDDLTEKRESKQPLEYASAGSTFKRPTGYFAGTLIEQTGLKGLSVGDAEVSCKHAGFVINRGNACAKDVLALIHEVQGRVHAAHGVHLEPEVRMLGEDIK